MYESEIAGIDGNFNLGNFCQEAIEYFGGDFFEPRFAFAFFAFCINNFEPLQRFVIDVGNQLWWVLSIAIHDDNSGTNGMLNTSGDGDLMAEVPRKIDVLDVGVRLAESSENGGACIG